MSSLSKYLSSLPGNIVEALQAEFQKLHSQYFLGHWEPAQLDAGRFAEAVLRIIEYKDKNYFTPIGSQLDRQKIINSAENNTIMVDSLRFQIPRLAGLILDFRNKRNVGHLGVISVNEMDSVFVLGAANWIVAELIRIETKISTDETQKEIKKIIERKVPIIEEIGGRLKCLNPKLNIKDKVLVFCYQKYPQKINLKDLFDWTEYSNKAVLRRKMVELNKDGIIDFRDDLVQLTRLGTIWVEKNIPFELDL